MVIHNNMSSSMEKEKEKEENENENEHEVRKRERPDIHIPLSWWMASMIVFYWCGWWDACFFLLYGKSIDFHLTNEQLQNIKEYIKDAYDLWNHWKIQITTMVEKKQQEDDVQKKTKRFYIF
jgi:hypothetical protein